MASRGQNDRSELRDDDDDEDQEYRDISEDAGHMEGDSEGELEEQEGHLLTHLTPSQRDAAIENLEIETMDRIQKLRASIGVLTNSLKFRAEAEMNRLPAAIRAMTVEDFWFTYNGSAKDYLEQQAKTKALANTAFLHALGKVDQKRKRETPGQADDLWQQKKRNRDEQRQKQPQASGYMGGSSSMSSNTSQHRPSHHSARHNPYPDQQQHRQQSPFVGPRSTRGR
ncbi:hypothetical protein BGZ95_011992 [Linnemannia exigua]|uniref:Borealin N-terminal domain-containing protein n=1 Tax=Linnemannia exigua TaxID=604196 RepID=A0AAD4DB81_9FUNG|nr:hypothetical protein BGZ95_011992 [Linnemannia exigua]